jgi:hypothetical protein
MKIGKNILDKKSNGISPSKRQECKQLEKLEQRKKKRTEDTEENIKYKLPSDEGDATSKDLEQQTAELHREKSEFDARHDVPLDAENDE